MGLCMTSIMIDRTDGLSSSTAVKGPCRVATTVNITLAGLQTVDGVPLAAGDRVLVKNQTAATENGIYVVDTGFWRRAKDFSGNRDVRRGTQVFVITGFNAPAEYSVVTDDPVIVDVSAIHFQLVETLVRVIGNGALLANTETAENYEPDDPAEFTLVAGTDEAGDAGDVLLYRPVASPPILGYQDTNGDYWELANNEILPEMAGVIANDSDRGAANALAFQKAGDSGKEIRLAKGKTYYSDPFSLKQGGLRGTRNYSTLVPTTLSGPFVTLDALNPAVMEDVLLYGVGHSGSGIYVDPEDGETVNYASRFSGLTVTGFNIGLHMKNASAWNLQACTISGYTTAGVWVEDDRTPDAGDSTINGCIIAGTAASGLRAGIVQKNSGGLRIVNNKLLMGGYGYILSADGGITQPEQSTSILLIQANSFEHHKTSAIYLGRAEDADPSIYFMDPIVVGNQINGSDVSGTSQPTLILIEAALNALNGVIANNVLRIGANGGTGISIGGGKNMFVGGNVIRDEGGTTNGIVLGDDFEGTLGPWTPVNLDVPLGIAAGAKVKRADRWTQKGTGSKAPTTAYGTMFNSAPQTVTFDVPFLEVPTVKASITNGGSGGLSVLVNSVTTTGFSYVVTAVNNSSTVNIEWEATGL